MFVCAVVGAGVGIGLMFDLIIDREPIDCDQVGFLIKANLIFLVAVAIREWLEFGGADLERDHDFATSVAGLLALQDLLLGDLPSHFAIIISMPGLLAGAKQRDEGTGSERLASSWRDLTDLLDLGDTTNAGAL